MPRASAAGAHRPLVAGIGLSHPDRMLFPEADLTKRDLAEYYEQIAGWVIPHIEDRPLTLVRCPGGVGAEPCFYMKHSKVWAPAPLRRVRIREKTKIGEYLIADTLPALVGLVQMGILEVHTWNSRFARAVAEAMVRRRPDRFTTRFSKAGREDKVLVDYLRNNRTNTSIAAYSTRAKPAAPVSVPVGWGELSPARTPDRFTALTVPGRLGRLKADPWKAYWTTRQTIARGAAAALQRL